MNMRKKTFYGFGRVCGKPGAIEYHGQVFTCGSYDFGYDREKKVCIELKSGLALPFKNTMKSMIDWIIDNMNLIKKTMALRDGSIKHFSSILSEQYICQPESQQVILTVRPIMEM